MALITVINILGNDCVTRHISALFFTYYLKLHLVNYFWVYLAYKELSARLKIQRKYPGSLVGVFFSAGCEHYEVATSD